MSFWIAAIVIPLVAAFFLAWPLLIKGKQWLGFGVAILLLVPTLTILLYQDVGTPEGIDVQAGPHRGMPATTAGPGTAAGAGDMNQMLTQLRSRLEASPDDLDGWMLLGRSYKAVQEYGLALDALRTAQQLAPNEPMVQIELAEALMFTSQGQTTDEMRSLLSSAMATSPDQQKGLWLSGIVAAQSGDDQLALNYWQRLMKQLEPGSPVAESVQEQIQLASVRLGVPNTVPAMEGLMPPPAEEDGMPNLSAPVRPMMPETAIAPPSAPATMPEPDLPTDTSGDGWNGVVATITAPGNLGPLPGSATLFLIARDPAAPNPPLGAMRIPNPIFPITLQLTDANSMMPQRPISGPEQIEVSARLSMLGGVMPDSRDPRSERQLINTNGQARIELELALP